MDVTLYRCPTPTNRLCACGRVARELKADGIAVREVRVPFLRTDRRPEVEALTGQDVVPVLVIDGEAICDSHRIVEHLRWRAEQATPARGPAPVATSEPSGRRARRAAAADR